MLEDHDFLLRFLVLIHILEYIRNWEQIGLFWVPDGLNNDRVLKVTLSVNESNSVLTVDIGKLHVGLNACLHHFVIFNLSEVILLRNFDGLVDWILGCLCLYP